MSSSSVILVNSLLIVSKTPTLKNHHQFTCIKLRLLTLKLVVDIFDGREKKTLFTNQYQLRKKNKKKIHPQNDTQVRDVFRLFSTHSFYSS